MKISDFEIGEKFRLKRKGYQKDHFIVLGFGESEQNGPYVRVQNLAEPTHSPSSFFEFQIELFADELVRDADLKRNIEMVEAAIEFLPMGEPIPYDIGTRGIEISV